MALSKSANLAHAQTAVPCNICEDEPPGEYYCIECKQTLCPQCENNHRRVAATKSHNIVLRTQVGDIDTTSLTCIDHGDHASFHCEKCNIPVCGRCITEKHRGHELSQLADIFDREKKVLQTNVTRMRGNLSKLRKEREEMITEKIKFDSKLNQITKDLEAERKAAIKELQRIYDDKTKDLVSIQKHQSTLFDGYTTVVTKEIDMLEDRIIEYQNVIRKNNLPAAINLSKRKEFIPEVGMKPKLPDLIFVPGMMQKLCENLGQLQVSSSIAIATPLKQISPTIVSKFKCSLKGPTFICISKEGDVWLGGMESNELVMVDIKGQVLRRRKIQNRPYSLAVMDCGDIIISPGDDSTSVSRLLRDDREQHVYDTSPSWNAGVSVTADQKILICIEDGRVVRANCDGTNVKQMYKGHDVNTVFHALENADGNIYISDVTNRALVMINKDGKVLSTITESVEGKRLTWPLGLASDKIGNISVADRESHCIYIIDRNHQMRELIGQSHGIEYPLRLAVDNDNNLWITQRDGTVHVVKYLG